MIIKQLFIYSLLLFGFGNLFFQTQNTFYPTLLNLTSYITHPKSKIQNLKSFHAYHTSLTQVEYNAKSKSLEISIRLFTDDFESGLTKVNNGQKVIITANDKNDALVSKYIQQHFGLISSQKQKKNFNYIGKELEGQATWIYIEMLDSQAITGFSLQNDLLMDLFDDQTNLVNFTYLSDKKTFIFTSKKTVAEIAF